MSKFPHLAILNPDQGRGDVWDIRTILPRSRRFIRFQAASVESG